MRFLSNTKPQADGTAMCLEFFHTGKLHNCGADVDKTFSGKIGAGDVFDVRTQVDARVLLCVSEGSWHQLAFVCNISKVARNLRREWLTPAE